MQNNIYYKTYSSGFFKIVRETACYYFMKSLKMDRELKVDTSVLFFSFGENDHYKHYADEIDQRSEEIKIMKKILIILYLIMARFGIHTLKIMS